MNLLYLPRHRKKKNITTKDLAAIPFTLYKPVGAADELALYKPL